jgi:hypothetical protein
MNDWGYVNWSPELGQSLVHPDDVGLFGSGVQGLLGIVASSQDGWVSFRFGESSARIKQQLIHPCSPPVFSYGQMVQALPPRTPFTGEIRTIQWHFKHDEPFFLVGPKHSRYFAHELHAA